MSQHARLSPSGAERWMVCAGSPRMEDLFPDEETSIYSSEGTAAHEVREVCLKKGTDVETMIGEIVSADGIPFEVTAEWARYLQPGIDRIREFKGDWVYEYRVDMEPFIPEGFGTLDTGGISADLIIIDDLKFGRGIAVEAERNKQLMIYALGFWKNYARHKTKATNFLIRIDQPRVPGGGTEWRTTLAELLEFAEDVTAAALRTLDPDAPLVPTLEGCRFCKAARNAGCYALDQFVLELLGLTLADLDLTLSEKPKMVNLETMSPERRSYLVAHAGMVRNWLNSIHGAVLQSAMQGEDTPGFKAVATVGDRSWTDEAEAIEFWKGKVPQKDLYTQKFKSPTQLEAIAGTRNWAAAQALISRPEGKPALVSDKDPRPALIPLMDLLADIDDDLCQESDLDLDDLI